MSNSVAKPVSTTRSTSTKRTDDLSMIVGGATLLFFVGYIAGSGQWDRVAKTGSRILGDLSQVGADMLRDIGDSTVGELRTVVKKQL